MLKYRLILLTLISLLLFSCNESSRKVEDDIFMALGREDVTAITAFLESGTPVDVTDDILHTPLMLAAAEANMEMVELFLSKGADPLLTDRAGRNALTHAVRGGNLEPVERMVKLGGDLKQLDRSKKTLLMHAAEKNRPDLITYLLKKGLKLEDKSFTGNRALMYAAESNHLESVKLLVQRGALINAKDNYGSTALSLAVDFGHYETARYLLERGADIKVMSNYEETLLTSAVHYSDIKMVELLLDYGADIEAKDMNNFRSYTYSLDKNRYNYSKLLEERGADTRRYIGPPLHDDRLYRAMEYNNRSYDTFKRYINIDKRDINGADESTNRTALMQASYEYYPDKYYIAKLLIESGADLMLEDNHGSTALDHAIRKDNLSIIALIVASDVGPGSKQYKFNSSSISESYNQEKITRLFKELSTRRLTLKEAAQILEIEYIMALYNNNFAEVKAHLDRPENIKDVNLIFDGGTPLIVAANNGNMEMVQYLLSKGADTELRASKGYIAADFALMANHYEITNLLFKESGLLFLLTGTYTPLTYYAEQLNATGLKYFIEQGYDTEEKAGPVGIPGETPLMKLITESDNDGKSLPALETLLKGGAKLETKKSGGITALMMAAAQNKTKIIPHLLEAGAEIDNKDSNGVTALGHAALSGSYEAAELLIAKGADIHILADKRRSLIDLGYRYPVIVKLLLKNGHKPDQINISLLGGVGSTFLATLQKTDTHISTWDLLNRERLKRISLEFDDRPLPTFKLLLEHGAAPYAGYNNSYNALQMAYNQRNRVAMRILVEKGYNLEMNIENVDEIVMESVKNKTRDLLHFILDAGAPPDLYNEEGYTPLYEAIDDNELELAKLLVAAGADVNKQMKGGEFPLFRAIWERKLDLVKLLVENGASLDIVDEDGEDPLENAVRANNKKIIAYLELKIGK